MKYFITLLLCLFSILATAAEYISSASERILATEPVDAAANLNNWSVRRAGMTKFFKGKKAGSDITISFNEDHGGLDFSYFPYVFGKNPLLNSVVLSLKHIPREIFNKYNAISCDVYPERDDRASLWFEVRGSKWTQACCPLRPRQWNRITICWSQQTPAEARKINSLVFSRQNFGRLPGDPQWSQYHIRNIRFENIVVGTEYSWDASPEKIILPQCGFKPSYIKQAVLSSTHKADDFIVMKNGKTVFKGKLKTIKTAQGSFKIADFTPIQTEGTYIIRSGNLESVPFAISNDNMKKAAALNMNFIYSMRSGMATPAHPECYLDDCIRSDNRKQVDVSGGWFDASDLRGYHSMAIKTIMRPLAISRNFNVPAVYEEALWGAKLLAKLYDPESGLPYTVHSLYPRNNPDKRMAELFKIGHFYKVNNYWTDNKPNSGDERVIHYAKGTYICHPDLQDNHWGMTSAGILFYLYSQELNKDKELAAKILALSKKHFDFMCDSDAATLRKNGIGPYYQYKNNAVSLLLETAINMYIATGKTYYREMAFKYADTLLSRQIKTPINTTHGEFFGFFANDNKKNSSNLFTDMQYAANLAKVADTFPEHEIANRIISALQLYREYFVKNPSAYAAPYNVPYLMFTQYKPKNKFSAELGTTNDGKKWYGSFNASFLMGPLGAHTLDTLALAQFMNDSDLQQYAARMLYFHYGENQSGRALIADAGINNKRDIMSSALGWIPGMGNNPDLVKGIPSIPYHRHYHSNEIYTQTQGCFIVANTILAAPAKLTFNFKNSDGISLKIFDGTKCAASGNKLDAVQSFELTGAKDYDFVFSNGLKFKRTVLLGEKSAIDIDFNSFILPDTITGKKYAKAGETVEFELPVYAFGKDVKEVWFSIYGENITLEKSSVNLKVESGKTSVLKFKGTVKKADAPFVIIVRPKSNMKNFRSFSGIVR